MINQEQLKEFLDYNPETGIFTWLKSRRRAKAGDTAGSIKSRGYIDINVLGEEYRSHRLAWLYVYGKFPPNDIDHINGDRIDNRIINLRSVTRSENAKNICRSSNNTSGTTGVVFHKSTGKWQAQIKVDGKSIYLGIFKHIDDAILVRKAAEKEHGFHKNHGRN